MDDGQSRTSAQGLLAPRSCRRRCPDPVEAAAHAGGAEAPDGDEQLELLAGQVAGAVDGVQRAVGQAVAGGHTAHRRQRAARHLRDRRRQRSVSGGANAWSWAVR